MLPFLRRRRFRIADISLPRNFAANITAGINTKAAETSDSVNWEHVRPYEEIPGPKPLPVIGNLHRFIPVIGELAIKDFIHQQEYLHKKYGKIVKVSGVPGRRDMLSVFDPKYIEQVYRNEGQWPQRDIAESITYYRKVHRKDFFKGVGGLITESGETWKTFRTKVNPPLMQPRIARMYLRPIAEVTNDFIERTRSLRDSKGEVPDDYGNELNKWSLESITMIALDKRLGCLDQNHKLSSETQNMIEAIHTSLSSMEALEFGLPLWKIISTPTWRRFVASFDFLSDVAMRYINDAIKHKGQREKEADYEPSVLERLLLRDPDPKCACVMALDMIAAGVDTTSFSVASLLYHLSKNQDKQEYLFRELVKFLPNRNDDITNEKIEDMKYMRACMKESMRLSGVATTNMRGTQNEVVIGNYRVPKGVNIYLPHLLVGRLEENYPEADRFIPERWLKYRPNESEFVGSSKDFDKVQQFKKHPFAFMPFGFGPRMCIGKRFAELELEVMIIKMIRNFRVEYNYGEMKFASKLIHKPISPLKYKFSDRTI